MSRHLELIRSLSLPPVVACLSNELYFQLSYLSCNLSPQTHTQTEQDASGKTRHMPAFSSGFRKHKSRLPQDIGYILKSAKLNYTLVKKHPRGPYSSIMFKKSWTSSVAPMYWRVTWAKCCMEAVLWRQNRGAPLHCWGTQLRVA